jgi:SOS-response transcriptional repressor LexA
MSNWVTRLKQKMQELQLTQEELARKMGVTRSAVAHYVQGTRQPPLRQMVKLAAALKTDPSWLQFGKTQESVIAVKQSSKKGNQIPILEWHETPDYSPNQSYSKKLEFFNYSNVECYAIQIKGDAMISPVIGGISFNLGSYAIIDPNKIPEHGNYVLSSLGNKKEAVLRQYIEEGGIVYLKPLNTQYALMQMQRSTKILGVVIANIHLA